MDHLLCGGVLEASCLGKLVETTGAEQRRFANVEFAFLIEQSLALDVTPASWPIGMGRDFLGTWDLFNDALLLFERGAHNHVTEPVGFRGLDDPELARRLPAAALTQLREEVEMARGLCPPFDAGAFRAGHQTPVYFGSALNNFGVRELLHGIAALAPPPRAQPAQRPDGRHSIAPEEKEVAGFVFKVQANIDPQHRDRIAFVRLASGRFHRGMKLKNMRTGRVMSVQAPVFFLARERNLAEEAWPGDIIGIPNHGSLRIGDTSTECTPHASARRRAASAVAAMLRMGQAGRSRAARNVVKPLVV